VSLGINGENTDSEPGLRVVDFEVMFMMMQYTDRCVYYMGRLQTTPLRGGPIHESPH